MDIFINEFRNHYQPRFPLTWGEFFSELHENYIGHNHGIIRVLLDNKDSLIAIKKNPHYKVPENIKKIQVFTKDTLSITKEGFIKVLALTDSIRCEVPTTVHLYRTNQTKIASEKIKKILKTIKPMIDFVNSVGINFSLNFDEIFNEKGISLKEEIESFIKSFAKLIKVQEKNDCLEIADYLEDQFLKDISSWSKITKRLLKEVCV